MNILSLVMVGAIIMGFWVSGLFFFHFWAKTRDRLFMIFGVAFWAMGVEHVVFFVVGGGRTDEKHPAVYIFRLLAYLLIIGGIIDKNRARKAL